MKLCSKILVAFAVLFNGLGVPDVRAGQITLQNATATFSQAVNFPVGFAIDDPSTVGPGTLSGDLQPTGWAILQFGTTTLAETAVFETDPLDPDLPKSGSGTVLTVTLDFQYEDTFFGADSAKFNLGRFRLSVTTDDRSTFADGLATGGDVSANWTILDPSSFVSSDVSTTFTKLGDNSLLANALSSNLKQTYTVVAHTSLTDITGVRLEALEDDSLVLDGPGRFPIDGNFVLTTFSVDATAVEPLKISGRSLLVRDKDGTPGKRKIVASSKDENISPGLPGSTGDPTISGAVLEILNPATGEQDTFVLTASNWTGVGNPPGSRGYRYKDRSLAEGPCNNVTIEDGKVKALCKGEQILFSLDEPSQGSLGVSLIIGELSFCMEFGGTIQKDKPATGGKTGLFKTKNAPAPADCP